MALKSISNASFFKGVLVSATWTPSAPRLIVTARSSSKNRYTKYPVIKDDIEGTGTFVELTISTTYLRVGLTESAAMILQDGIEGAQFAEDDNTSTSGGYSEQDRITHAFQHEYTVEKKLTKMVDWVEGIPEEEAP